MSSTGIAATLALVAGVAGSAQVAVMGRFGDRIGTLEALAFSTALTAFVTLLALAAVRRSFSGYADAWASPKWLWIGALMGAFIVLSVTVAGPAIGTTATVALLIAGQLATAVAIDRFGWFGVDRIEVSWIRLVGIVLLVLGSVLVLRR